MAMQTPTNLLVISLNEVFGDIMLLASPRPPPVDPDDVNTRLEKYSAYFLKFYMWLDTPMWYFSIEI